MNSDLIRNQYPLIRRNKKHLLDHGFVQDVLFSSIWTEEKNRVPVFPPRVKRILPCASQAIVKLAVGAGI
jgi:hypothetical protein